MEKIFGVDLGTNSIGWAIREVNPELENQIIDKGVLTFKKGVGEGKSGEFPMVQKRTESRSKRRNYQAEKYRKYSLLETLISHDMCPLTTDELNHWRHYVKGVGRRYPQSETFVHWLRFDFDGDGKPDFEMAGFDKHENHYLFRMLAVSEEPAHKKLFAETPMLLGRVLYHLVQRRGFRGRDDESEEAKSIMKGSEKAGTAGVEAIQDYLHKYNTLGAALYHLQKEKGGRIRKRYNLRTDYEHELKEICRVQGIGEELYKQLRQAIIWQRPLRSQKGLVGFCTLESPKRDEETSKYLSAGKKRCPVSHPLYEEYRTWVFINNLKIVVPEGNDKAEFLQEHVYPVFYKSAADFKLSSIENAIKKTGAEITAKFSKDTKVLSVRLLYKLQQIFGGNFWNLNIHTGKMRKTIRKDGMVLEHEIVFGYEDIWHVLATFDSREKLKEFALEKLKLDEAKAEDFSKIKLQQGYATLSLSAIKKLLPYLKQGFRNDEAVFLANMHKVLGEVTLTQEKANEIAAGIRQVMQEHETSRHAIAVLNGLISDQLNEQHKFFKEQADNLDADDVATIRKKMAATIPMHALQNLGIAGENYIYTYASTNYLNYLRKGPGARTYNAYHKGKRLHDRIFEWLQDAYSVSEDRKKYLWHPSEQETYVNAPEKHGVRLLGDPRPVSNGFKNPMALKTLYKLKGVVNYLLESGKIDEDTRIVVEIARELNDTNMRKAIERYQRERERENDDYKKIIDEINAECKTSFNREDKVLLDKIRLWKEQNMRCLYTGETINKCDLFNGVKYDFEHTIPASMSFDNELKNLTIANSRYNREVKQNRIPYNLPNYGEDAGGYSAIKPRLEFMEEEVVHYEKLVDSWKFQAKVAQTKDRKDYCIIEKHLSKFQLDYWRKKLDTFTIKEYRAGWRNSQLRDTQIVTKYALPYLKTVFKKVEVQKGQITADFRNIFNAAPKQEKKSRDKHSHHAIDAAVLTLIPPAAIRDQVLQRYNEAKDAGLSHHEKPRNWEGFEYAMLLAIEDDVLINFQAQHRTLIQTKKHVRKRGKQQFVKVRDSDGKWHYKLNAEGKKIPLIATGDTIRGQLHKESFFGAVKQGDETLLVERYPVAAFTSIADCKNIIDKAVREIVETELYRRMQEEELSFDKAKLDPISWPNGKAIIKKVRCKVAAGRGYLKPQTALEVHRHTFESKHDYKRYTYAQNDSNELCLYYEGKVAGELKRAFKLVGLFGLANLKLSSKEYIKKEEHYATTEAGKGKNKQAISLASVIEVGCRTIFFKESIDELKVLSKEEITRRLFLVYKFNEMGTPQIYLQFHLEARPNDQLGDGDTIFDPAKRQHRLKLKADKFTCAIEGNHFEILPDGEIKWLY